VALTKRFLAVHGDEWDLECEVRALGGCTEPARIDQARQKSTATAEN